MSQRKLPTRDTVCFLLLAVLTLALFSQLFYRENSLSYSIGYNLYGAERVLEGETPYRDFHTLYPPAIVYLNAAIFKFFSVSLYDALFTVFLFKTLTTFMVYFCARRLMPYAWAFGAAIFSLLWLRPNGAFKAVPMHYGALFLSIALFFLLGIKPAKRAYFFAGLAIGILALFKHNIGAYALIGALALFFVDEAEQRLSLRQFVRSYRDIAILIAGILVTVLPVLVFMQSRGALRQMVNTLLFGPGEFLLNRLAAAPLPFVPILFALWMVFCAYFVNRFKGRQQMALLILSLLTASIILFALLAKQNWVDAVIFYVPVFVILAGFTVCIFAKKIERFPQRQILALTFFTAAAFMEAFPRFAREQAIAAMPFVALLLIVLLYTLRASINNYAVTKTQYRLAMLILPLLLFLIGTRLFVQTWFDKSLHFKSDTSLVIERGKGVYFPADKAAEIDNTVQYIQERVPENGYYFAQSYAGSSYLFLANRRNPSGAQFWGGVGVTEAERQATLAALQQQQVKLIVTSRRDMEAEKFAPMRDYINENFKVTREFGEVLILER